MVPRPAAALLLALAMAGEAAAAPADHSGVYGDVTISGVTGDAGGFQVEFHDRGERSTIVFTMCEGGCWGGKTWPVTLRDQTITFSVTDEFDDKAGNVEQTTTRYVGVFVGSSLKLSSPDRSDLHARLKRVKNPRPGETAELANF